MAKNKKQAEAPVRTIDTVNQEYTNLCAKIGHEEFQRALLNVRLNELYASLSILNEEAGKLKEAASGSADATK